MTDDLERLVDEFVAPLRAIAPAAREHGRAVIRRHQLIALAVALVVAAVAISATWATIEVTASPAPAPVSPGQRLACLHLVGGTAKHARAVLRPQHEAIIWHLVTYDPPDGSTWTTTRRASVPDGAVVDRVLNAPLGRVIIVVYLPRDRYAKPPVIPACTP